MKIHNSRGILYAFSASVALAASFIFSKSVLNNITLVQFGFVWFSLGVVWNSIWFSLVRDYRHLNGNPGKKVMVAIAIAILEGIATELFYIAIQKMENPAIVSFIGNIGPVFVTLLGISILRERFRSMQVAGIIITLAGVFLINYRIGGLAGFMKEGSLYIVLASFFFALATIMGRGFNKFLVPGFMSLLRSALLSVSFLFLLIKSDQGIPGDFTVWRDMMLGSLLETLITIVLAYQALKLISATQTSLIISTRSVWTLLLAWIFLKVFPAYFQLAGGILTLVGVWLITWSPSAGRRG